MPKQHWIRAIAVTLGLPLMLASCGTLSALGSATTPLEVYELQTPTNLPVRQGAALRRDVIIEVPTTSGALATDRIMLRPSPLKAQYLPEVRWSEEAPVMIQTLMLRALDQTGSFQFVGRRPLGAGGDFAIVTELIDFQAEVASDGGTARVDVRFVSRIVRESSVQIVAARSFAATEVAQSLDDDAIAAAFDAATSRAISDFVLWTMSSLGAG